jgi:S-formylglutathione hydrolase FrmB
MEINLADQLEALVVVPEFPVVPWYGDHESCATMRQESFLVDQLVPWIEECFPVKSNKDFRWLLGFSKSGFGAFSLLLRHPDVFGMAAVWDVPWLLDGSETRWGIAETFGSTQAWKAVLPETLLDSLPDEFKEGRPRLILTGSRLFGPGLDTSLKSENQPDHTISFHRQLQNAGFLHVYDPSLDFPHHWEGGWILPLMDLMKDLLNVPSDKET